MNIACISDTHGVWLPDIPDDVDVVIHAGDIGPDGGVKDWFLGPFTDWARKLDIPIYATFGNHDFVGERPGIQEVSTWCPENVALRVDEQVDIEGVKFWFSPWSNLFGNWAFMRTEEGLTERYDKIPEDTQIIVSHGPPKGYGDKIFWDQRDQHVGSTSLLKRFVELPNASLLICGHIHGAAGVHVLPWIKGEIGVRSVINCSQVDEEYQPVYNAVRYLEL